MVTMLRCSELVIVLRGIIFTFSSVPTAESIHRAQMNRMAEAGSHTWRYLVHLTGTWQLHPAKLALLDTKISEGDASASLSPSVHHSCFKR